MFRDDREAADALAQQLRRDNADLEEENKRLKAELASRPAPSAADSRKQRKRRARAEQRAQRRAAREAAGDATGTASEASIARDGTYARTPVRDWAIRIGCGGGVAVLVLAINSRAYPAFNHGKTSLFIGIFGAVICQAWNLLAISQAVLGWWPVEGGRQLMRPRNRVLAFAGGVVAVVLTALFGAAIGEASPD